LILKKKLNYILICVCIALSALSGCKASPAKEESSSEPLAEASSEAEPSSVSNMAHELEWNYRAFGQSVDLRFQASGNVPEQDGINNVWINPSWVDRPDLNDPTPVVGKPSTRPGHVDPNGQVGKSGVRPYIFTKSSAFIPPLEGALEHDKSVKLKEGDKVVLESRGGKITNGHDGITFFYVTLPTDRLYKLTADITKSSVASNPASGANGTSNQAGAGIMARDFVGEQRAEPYRDGYEEPPACSNFAGIGLWNAADGRPSYARRTGVTSPIHAVGHNTERGIAVYGTDDTDMNAIAVGLTFTYTLERANDGFYYQVGETEANGGKVLVPRTKIPDSTPDMLQMIDGDNMYWGFAAAREMRILVENVVLTDEGEADFVPAPPAVTDMNPDAEVDLRSRSQTAKDSSVLALRPNHNGVMKVTEKITGAVVFDEPVTAYNEAYISVNLEMGDNDFNYEFEAQEPDVNVKIARGTAVITRNAATPTTDITYIWAAPEAIGKGTGTDRANAMDISSATAAAEPGQTIYLIDEKYTEISIGNSNSGSPDHYVTIMPEPGVPYVCARNVKAEDHSTYMHFKGIHAGGEEGHPYEGTGDDENGSVFNMGQSDYMIVENCTAMYSTGSGFSHNGGGGNKGTWAKYNTYINCTAMYNQDEFKQNSDGFQMQGFGVGNKYIGCVAAYAGDDGWDHFLRVGEGPGGDIYYENCIAYGNNANGFKLGGEGQPTPMELVNCLSYDNGMAGFSDNFNPGNVKLINCTAVDNGTQNFIMRDNPNVTPKQELAGCISYRTVEPGKFYIDAVAGSVSNSALILDDSRKSVLDGEVLTDSAFVSLDKSLAYSRDKDGNLVRGDFASRWKISK
jgi:hypothetical protein